MFPAWYPRRLFPQLASRAKSQVSAGEGMYVGRVGLETGPRLTMAITRMPATERHRRPADQRMPGPGAIRPPEDSPTVLTAKPLDLDYKHKILSAERPSAAVSQRVTRRTYG